MKTRQLRPLLVLGCMLGIWLAAPAPAQALDKLCDPSHEDCRAILISYIRAEKVGIDVGFWFMEDARYTTELIKRFQAGVPVRVIMDVRANESTPANVDRLNELKSAGIPMRTRTANGIMHYKLMVFAGQSIVEFSGANFSADAWVYTGTSPYVNYVDESVYFTNRSSFVHSFMTKFDDLWTTSSGYANYANVPATRLRNYPTYTKDSQLNFPPAESYANRALGKYNVETEQIDVIMYRITDARHTDAMIAAKKRGVPVRVISDPQQYRDATRLWDAWNVDRMYIAGIPIKMRAHAGLNHEKLVLLYGQHMSIFGSSNWTSASDDEQEEHNCFCTDLTMFDWFTTMFDRKWNNSAGVTENSKFTPLPPNKPVNHSPANSTSGVSSSVTLKWYAGPWAHKYDVLIGVDPNNLTPMVSDKVLGPSTSSTDYKSVTATNLRPGTTYYWRVIGRTMANISKAGDIWSFTTTGTAAPPPSNGSIASGDIVLYGGQGRITGTKWSIVSDSTAAGGKRLWNPNAGAAKITTAASSPSSYVQFTFNAVAGKPYHLWIRGRAEGNVYTNDSAFVQFSNSVTSTGAATMRIGTTSAAEYNLENCNGCGVSGWGWQDNAYGSGVTAAKIYFNTTGSQTLRIQAREDGLSIDQIILSPSSTTFLNASPGALKNDTKIYPAALGASLLLAPGTAIQAPAFLADAAPGAVGFPAENAFAASAPPLESPGEVRARSSDRFYALRIAVTGFTDTARTVGKSIPAIAMTTTVAAAAANVGRSPGVTPTRSDWRASPEA